MRLRQQLLLVSSLILFLPWAGCRYVGEMVDILRDGQAGAMRDKAQAIAAQLASEPDLFDDEVRDAQWFSDININQVQVYLHPLNIYPQLDGFGNEWSDSAIAPIEFEHASLNKAQFSAQVYAGIRGDIIYLNFVVFDSTWAPHHPQLPGIANGDHIMLRTKRLGFDVQQDFYLRTSATGRITARYFNDLGAVRSEPRISGFWRVDRFGYEVEVQLPRSVVGELLGYAIVNRVNSAGSAMSAEVQIGTLQNTGEPLPWITINSDIETVLQRYADPGQMITVFDRGRWLVARQGDILRQDILRSGAREDLQQVETPSGIQFWFYKLVLGNRNLPVLDNVVENGRLDSEELINALAGDAETRWYSASTHEFLRESNATARVAAPIVVGNAVVGAVAITENTDEILAATQVAFLELFTSTLIAVLIAIIGWVAYASILSFRIRRLSRAADTAVTDDGRIKENFLQSKARDEVGDLTRSYGQLLTRLREYTEYLRTLSSKLSHELRTPLAVVRSSLDNIEQEQELQSKQVYIERAKEGAARLANILTAMSAASHMEQSIQSSQIETFNLADLLGDVATAYGDTYAGVTVDCHVAGDHKDYVWRGSPDLMVQMLDKLVDNAADFAGQGGRVTLSLTREGRHYLVSVSNTGPLLPQNMQGQLFDSLVSIREGGRGKGGRAHLGLGLYIVRLVAEFHDGQVSARNLEDGSGVVFTVTLPINQ